MFGLLVKELSKDYLVREKDLQEVTQIVFSFQACQIVRETTIVARGKCVAVGLNLEHAGNPGSRHREFLNMGALLIAFGTAKR